jgi:hypothetical protein
MKFKGPFTPVRQCKLLISADSSLPFVLSIMFLFVILFYFYLFFYGTRACMYNTLQL